MAYYSYSELIDFGFKKLGKKVKISTKASIYNPEQIKLDDYVRIDDFCVLSGQISLGRYIHIAPFCLLAGGEKGITMRDFSGLAYGVKVFSQSDDYSGKTLTNPNIPKEFKREYKKEVIIGKHVIIGTDTIIFPGSILQDGVSVGACSLVKGRLNEWTVYGGNPVKPIRPRKKDLLELEKQFLAKINDK